MTGINNIRKNALSRDIFEFIRKLSGGDINKLDGLGTEYLTLLERLTPDYWLIYLTLPNYDGQVVLDFNNRMVTEKDLLSLEKIWYELHKLIVELKI